MIHYHRLYKFSNLWLISSIILLLLSKLHRLNESLSLYLLSCPFLCLVKVTIISLFLCLVISASIMLVSAEPNSEYVISLRAYNDMGDGRPVYVSVHTKEVMAPEPISPLIPPVGLMAVVLSSTTVVVYWTDTTLSKSQVV